MKYKFIFLLLFIGCAFTSFNLHQREQPNTSNMLVIPLAQFSIGLDTAHLLADAKRFNLPISYFSQEYPSFRVYVPAFYIDKKEVTNADYKKFIDANPEWSKEHMPDSLQDGNYLKDWNGDKYPKSKGKYPVVYVSWFAAKAYAKWVGKRLPIEVEWESAAKGTDKTSEFPWGDTDADSTKANYGHVNTGRTVKAGKYHANDYGLYDMAGNVKEFVLDTWSTDVYRLKHSPLFFKRRRLNEDINKIVVRGSGWQSPAVELRNTYREGFPNTRCAPDVGFRCALSIRTH